MNPILTAIRQLLTIQESASIAEIASIVGVRKKRVLDVVVANRHLLSIDRKSGCIRREDVRDAYRRALIEAGAVFWENAQDWGTVKTLEFKGHEELRGRIQEERIGGGFGDSYSYRAILWTDENVAAARAEGMVPITEAVIDDRAWKE